MIPNVIAAGIGVTIPGQDNELTKTIAAIRTAAPNVPILIGGAGISEEQAMELGADAWARTGEDAVREVEELLDR